MAFTTWKNFSRSRRRTRLCNQQILRRRHKQSGTGEGAVLPDRSSLDLHEARATRPTMTHRKAVQSAGCVRPLSSRQRQQWITQYPRKPWRRGRSCERRATTAPVQSTPCSWSLRCGGKNSMDPANKRIAPGPRPLAPSSAAPTRRPSGKGVVLRTGNDLGARSSGAERYGGRGQREKMNIRVDMCVCCDRESHNSHERDFSRISCGENRTQTTHTTRQSTPNIFEEDVLANTETRIFAHSPFVVGGPLCAKYPSSWTAAGVSVFNMTEPKSLIAWTSANNAAVGPGGRQQPCCTPGSDSWKRRGGDTTLSARHNTTSPSKHRPTYSSKAVTSEQAYMSSCKGIVHPHKLHNNKLPLSKATGEALVSRSAVSKSLQVVLPRALAPTSPSWCTTSTAVSTAVEKTAGTSVCHGSWGHWPPHQGRAGRGEGDEEESWDASCRKTCFGQYRLLID